MIKFIQKFIQKLKLNYLIWRYERLHKKWLKIENKIRGNKNGN